MILQTLNAYYDRLADDPEQDIAPIGFARQKISYCVVLAPDGQLVQVEDLRTEEGKRHVPARLVVPDRGGRSGTLIQPNFLWDNTGYALGCDDKRKPERTQKAFEAFRDLHRDFATQVEDEGLKAVMRFLDSWNAVAAEELPNWLEICGTNVVFRLTGQREYVHDSVALKVAWSERVSQAADATSGPCLVSGQIQELSRLHPMIKGVLGAQSSGAAIVSFNLPAFESYGKEQSYNSPVSIDAAFKYTTALNHLLATRRQRVMVGDTTVVFWTDKPSPMEAWFGPAIDSAAALDEEQLDQVRSFLHRLAHGKAAADDLGDPMTRFFVLGLAPNASRLSIRLWLVGTVAELHTRLIQHFQDLDIIGADPTRPPPIARELLFETAREAKDIQPLLGGALLRAILVGGSYPAAFYAAILRRIHADRRINHRRAAALKASLLRQYRSTNQRKEISVSLNQDHPDVGYQLGRWFAALEKIQKDATGEKLNATIKDRFYSAASATPASVFPRLIRMNQHHMNKIDSIGLRVTRDKLIQEICGRIERFPKHLSLEQQGLFAIGYYHQTQEFYTRHSDVDSANEESQQELPAS